MAINFPAGPVQGQEHTDPTCGVTWIWDGLCWLDAGTGGGGTEGPAGPQGPPGPTAVSADAANLARLGTDGLIYTPILSGFRNILMNGNRAVNQRGLDTAAVAPGAYGSDRWQKAADSGSMQQTVEAGNFVPSAVYTLSATNIPARQVNAPAGGNWTITGIPFDAFQIQLELGSIATPYENRSIAQEVSMCQRYYESWTGLQTFHGFVVLGGVNPNGDNGARMYVKFSVAKRALPTVTIGNAYCTAPILDVHVGGMFVQTAADSPTELARILSWSAFCDF